MNLSRPRLRTLSLLAALLPLLLLFVYVVLRSGPLAPIAVVAATVESRAISPALFGIGNVEAPDLRARTGDALPDVAADPSDQPRGRCSARPRTADSGRRSERGATGTRPRALTARPVSPCATTYA